MTEVNNIETVRLAFDREKWVADIALRERELTLREGELKLKVREQQASHWRSPLVVAILAATLAALGNAGIAFVNGKLTRDLESEKSQAQQLLEESKAESSRILEMIKTGDEHSAADNLQFLLDTGLITSEERIEKIAKYLVTRKPGRGVVLPAPSGKSQFGPVAGDIGFMPGVPLAPHHPDLGKGMIGIIDSGIRKDHPQIGDIVGAERDFTGEGIYDDLGHGTAVALVALQAHYNLAPQLRVLNESSQLPAAIAVAKIVGRAPVSEQEIAGRMIQAIEWLAEIKVRIVNISMAMPEGPADYTALCAAIAAQQDMLFVMAAGSPGSEVVEYPAACLGDNTLAVGVDAQGQVPNFSGRADVIAQLPPRFVSTADHFRQEGDRLIQNNDLEGAKQAYVRGLGEQPTPELRALLDYGLGYVGHKSGDDDTALMHFRDSTEAWPAYPDPYVAISAILGERGDLAAARTWLGKGLAAGAESPPLLDRLIRVLLDLDQPEPALTHIARLKQLEPDESGLASLDAAAQNFMTVIDAVQGGQDPLDLLYLSAGGGDAVLVRFITRRFAPPLDAISALGKVQVLILAAQNGHEAVVRMLLASGASIDTQQNELELTALMAAATGGHDSIVGLLIEHGAKLDLVDNVGFTALMFAAEGGRLDVVRRLLEAGAAIAPKSTEQLDATGYALKYDHLDVADLIAQAKSCPRLKCAQ